MAQKQKLKSERRSGNTAMMDLFLTLEPQSFKEKVQELSHLFDTDKKSFNLLLEKFDALKGSPIDNFLLNRKKFIDKEDINAMLQDLLSMYWYSQEDYAGGYLKCMLPKQKEYESDNDFKLRLHEMEDILSALFVSMLREYDYFKR